MTAPSELFQGVYMTNWATDHFTAQMGNGAGTAVQGSYNMNTGTEQANYFICTSQQEIDNYFGINASVGVNYALQSVQDKFGFFNSINMQNTDVTVIVAAMQQKTYSGTDYRPRSDVQYVSNHKITDQLDFHKLYGDAFVSELVVGGRFFAYYKLSTSVTRNQSQVVNQIQAALGGGQGALQANVDVGLSKVLSNLQHTVHVQSGYRIIGAQGMSINSDQDYCKFALEFPSMSLNAPTIVGFSTSPYDVAGLTT